MIRLTAGRAWNGPAGGAFEVPERQVMHDFDDDEGDGLGHMVGEAQPLPMSQKAKGDAARRRARLDELGGFGFGSRST